jgi:hypothetical protein
MRIKIAQFSIEVPSCMMRGIFYSHRILFDLGSARFPLQTEDFGEISN